MIFAELLNTDKVINTSTVVMNQVAQNEVVNNTGGLITDLGRIGLWLQAAGIAVIIWIIFQIIGYILNRRRLRMLDEIKLDMDRIEKKIDRILKNKK